MRRPRPLILTSLVVAVTAFALLAAGCGGGGSPGIASVASSTGLTTTTQNGLVAFALCMRSHGVPNFPEGVPKASPQQLGVSQSQLQVADSACDHLLPNGGNPPQAVLAERLRGLLAFAHCMRSHGVPSFPDPGPEGQVSTAAVAAAGVDVHSPIVQAAARTCLPAAHGAITAAAIRRAEQGGH